jgi:hypothetical protein
MVAGSQSSPGPGGGPLHEVQWWRGLAIASLLAAPSTMLRICWGEIVFPRQDLGLPGAALSSKTLPVPGRIFS